MLDTPPDATHDDNMNWQRVVVTLAQLAFWALVVLACCTPVFGRAWCG